MPNYLRLFILRNFIATVSSHFSYFLCILHVLSSIPFRRL